jgi:hypothetical protein
VRAPFFSVPLITDEGGYAYVAHWLGRGLALYRDLWFDRPQAIFLIYRAQMHVLGESTEAIRLGAAVYNAVTTLAVFGLGSALAGRRAGVVAGAAFALWTASPPLEGFTANGELYMGLPVVAAVLAAVHRRWLVAGLLGGLACAIKPTATLSVGPALLTLLVWRPRSLRAAVTCVGGGVGALAPFVAHGVLTDPALYWYSVAGFRVSAHSAFSVGEALLADMLQTAPTALAAGAPLWLLAAAGIHGGWGTRVGAVATALLGGALLGAAAGGYWYWHYYVGLVPGAALAAGVGAARWGTPTRVRWTRWTRGAVLAVTGGVALFFNARVVGATPAETSLRLYERPAYVAAREIAAYVRDRTSERDMVYAAFAQADLYHLSGRRSAARHLYWTEINRVPGALDDLLSALADEARRPAYVIGKDGTVAWRWLSENPGQQPAYDEVKKAVQAAS